MKTLFHALVLALIASCTVPSFAQWFIGASCAADISNMDGEYFSKNETLSRCYVGFKEQQNWTPTLSAGVLAGYRLGDIVSLSLHGSYHRTGTISANFATESSPSLVSRSGKSDTILYSSLRQTMNISLDYLAIQALVRVRTIEQLHIMGGFSANIFLASHTHNIAEIISSDPEFNSILPSEENDAPLPDIYSWYGSILGGLSYDAEFIKGIHTSPFVLYDYPLGSVRDYSTLYLYTLRAGLDVWIDL